MRLVDVTTTGMTSEDAQEFAIEGDMPEPDRDRMLAALQRIEVTVDLDTGTLFAVNGKVLGTAADLKRPREER